MHSTYTLGKLAALNYRMAIHPGDANIRLASELDQILVLWPSDIPLSYRSKYDELIEMIHSSSSAAAELGVGVRPFKIGRMQNRTAAKYIKLLIDVEEVLKSESDVDQD